MACNGYSVHLFENLQLRLPHPTLSLPHGTRWRKKHGSSTCRFRITASLIPEKQAFLTNPLRKPCRRYARGLQKLPSSTTVQSGCASTTYGIAELIFSQSGYPLVVMVKPSQDRNCHHLVRRMLRGTRRSTRLRNLLLNTLMRSCSVEVGHINIEHTLELLLMKDQQVVEAFLSHTSQEAFADRIRSGSMIGCVEYLYSTRYDGAKR
jgi:hypothetical protein